MSSAAIFVMVRRVHKILLSDEGCRDKIFSVYADVNRQVISRFVQRVKYAHIYVAKYIRVSPVFV